MKEDTGAALTIVGVIFALFVILAISITRSDHQKVIAEYETTYLGKRIIIGQDTLAIIKCRVNGNVILSNHAELDKKLLDLMPLR